MPESNKLQPGQQFGNGRFVLTRFLGRGGMGEVWLAQDERLHEQVALKFLPSEIRGDPVALDDLRRETSRSHKLTHPNIVRIHDLHEDPDGTSFIVMEFIDGPTLAALRLQQPNRVATWDFLRSLLEQLCAALDYAHGEKVIHRDLKPANMMVDSRGRLKLADFGIAAVASDSMSRVSAQRTTSGTLLYMSPQQLAGKRAQATDDIYALGATLYELLTSQPPFHTGDLTHQVLHVAPEPMEERLAALEIQNNIPSDVAALIMACLAKEPGQRPQSAQAVGEWTGLEVVRKPSLEALGRDVFSGAAEIGPTAPAVSGSSEKSIWAVGVFAALLLLAAGGWYWAKHKPDEKPGLTQEKTAPPETKALDTPVEAVATADTSTTPQTKQPSILAPAAAENGFVSLFNGRDLTGWDGDPRFWSVEDNAIKGQSTPGNIPEGNNTYLIWTNGDVDDFELRLSYKLVNGDRGSGIQYRGRRTTGWVAQGYQADFWPASWKRSGLLAYEAPGRGGRPTFGLLAAPGQIVVWGADGKERVTGATAKSAEEIQAEIKEGDWNDYIITAIGNHLVHRINGNITMEATDNDVRCRFMSGLIGLKMRNNKGNPMEVLFKDIRLKRLTKETATTDLPASTGPGWIPLFDGKTLSGWTAPDPGDWRVGDDGSIVSEGPRSHLFSPKSYTNLEFKAEIKLAHNANGGMFFRAAVSHGLVKGYEAQAANNDPNGKTGSLYYFQNVLEQLVPDDTWFTQHVIAVDNRIVIKVNDRIVVDYVDPNYTYVSGHLALQHQAQGKLLMYRNAMVKPLSNDEPAAWAEARTDMPDLPR